MTLAHLNLHTDRPIELGLFIDGSLHGAGSREKREVVNPATEEVIGQLPIASTEDLDNALSAAARGFAVWSNTSAWQRQKVMNRAAALIGERKEKLAHALTRENGKPLADSMAELDRVIDVIEWCAEEGKRTYGRVLPPRAPGMLSTTLKRPIGPVAAFSPWNFPAFMLARKIAAALSAGCSIIAKPAEETPSVCLAIAQAFADAGLPPGALNVVFGVPSHISEHLIKSPVIRKVSFTGSVQVGKLLSKLAAEELKSVTMELGGHSPLVVFDDVNVEKVAAMCAAFKFRNAGQVCLSPNRIFVQERIHDEFVEHFVRASQRLKVGNGMEAGVQMGPLTNVRRLQAAQRFVEEAHGAGATVKSGGRRIGERGYFFEPTVLTNVNDTASIMHDEPFCPVVPIVAFSDFDDAVKRANAVEFGLAAYAFTASIARAASITEAFDAGWIGINHFAPALAELPMGGTKHSGIGYEGGPEGLDAYMHIKSLNQAVPVE